MRFSDLKINQSVDDLKRKIVSGRIAVRGAQGTVLGMLLARPDLVAFGTVQSVASECGVSGTTIVRVACKVGYSNFREMKIAFQKHIVETRKG
ncbi:MurR/RpiR family transcriptional regulator (plasmid) [Ensifer adhaerens]|uniref:MurR/RpiR family transcriptional regulator n=1 Tax=Ensifer adhaerens TaxID=106592 RepID=UPI0023A95532|nr:MurR/RpiR family transcriptional regulator [Ensifer adhaerens]WDZ81613.1 MurR/RpiR family transcriptional regulator [Ensifer adhaerens]